MRELQEEVDEARQRCEDLEAERGELEARLNGAMARNEQDSINRWVGGHSDPRAVKWFV